MIDSRERRKQCVGKTSAFVSIEGAQDGNVTFEQDGSLSYFMSVAICVFLNFLSLFIEKSGKGRTPHTL